MSICSMPRNHSFFFFFHDQPMDHFEDSRQRSIETIDLVITFNRVPHWRANIVRGICRDFLSNQRSTCRDSSNFCWEINITLTQVDQGNCKNFHCLSIRSFKYVSRSYNFVPCSFYSCFQCLNQFYTMETQTQRS